MSPILPPDAVPQHIANPPAIVWHVPEEHIFGVKEQVSRAAPSVLEIKAGRPKSTLLDGAVHYLRQKLSQESAPEQTQEKFMQTMYENWGPRIHTFARRIYAIDNAGATLPKLKDQQVLHVLNHLSLLDVAMTPYLFHQLGLRESALVARANMYGIPFFGEFFRKWPTITVPFEGITTHNGRQFLKQTNEHLDAGRSVGWWAEGGRSRTGEVGEFKTEFARVILKYAQRHNRPILVSPETTLYDSVIETPFFPLADFCKARYTKGKIWRQAYYATDLAAFGARAFYNTFLNHQNGIAAIVFGEPFDIRECRDESEVCQRARTTIIKNYRDWKPRLKELGALCQEPGTPAT